MESNSKMNSVFSAPSEETKRKRVRDLLAQYPKLEPGNYRHINPDHLFALLYRFDDAAADIEGFIKTRGINDFMESLSTSDAFFRGFFAGATAKDQPRKEGEPEPGFDAALKVFVYQEAGAEADRSTERLKKLRGEQIDAGSAMYKQVVSAIANIAYSLVCAPIAFAMGWLTSGNAITAEEWFDAAGGGNPKRRVPSAVKLVEGDAKKSGKGDRKE